MKVFIDGGAFSLLEGMRVRHALLAAGLLKKGGKLVVRDEWGNEVGLDGALHEGQKLFVTLYPRPGDDAPG